jgi:pimeloyl-ACP methyl ester carboxylesterase
LACQLCAKADKGLGLHDGRKSNGHRKLALPVLAIGGDHSYGAQLVTEIGFAASNVRSAVINNSDHWIMEEQPQQAIDGCPL